MSKKGDHALLRRLVSLTRRRLPFAAQVERYRRQRQWLIELEHLLDPEHEPPKTSASVAQVVAHYLEVLCAQPTLDAEDQEVAAHIQRTFHNLGWGLFACYDVVGLPRTNNELERFMRFLKTGQRRVSGRHNVHDFVIRYGAYAALIDSTESREQLLARLAQVDQETFLQERHRLDLNLLQETKLYRFRCQRTDYLAELETQWAAAVIRAKPPV